MFNDVQQHLQCLSFGVNGGCVVGLLACLTSCQLA